MRARSKPSPLAKKHDLEYLIRKQDELTAKLDAVALLVTLLPPALDRIDGQNKALAAVLRAVLKALRGEETNLVVDHDITSPWIKKK